MTVYLLWASSVICDDLEQQVIGVFTTKEGALEAQRVFDEKYKTNDYYSRVYTGIEEMPVNELKLAIDKG